MTQSPQRWIAAGFFLVSAALSPQRAGAQDATINLMNSRGQVAGHATLVQEPGSVRLRVDVTGLAPGAHGITFTQWASASRRRSIARGRIPIQTASTTDSTTRRVLMPVTFPT